MRSDQEGPRQASDDPAQAPEGGAQQEAPQAGTEEERAEGTAPQGDGAQPGELEAMRDRYLRLAAEYDNYRKRTDKEKSELWSRAQAQLVEKLLDALDDLQRVAHFNAETTSVQALLEGVQMVERKLVRVLEGAGLEVLDAKGQPFNPELHEALMMSATENRDEDDSVGEVFQKGYRFKGDLLRPARVTVRKFGG